ncbi:MAG TPA: diguanylate cyclase, partial [Armatimonadota bacterium]
FFEELTLTEIARKMQISVNYSSYLLKRGVNHIKELIAEQQPGKGAAETHTRQRSRATDRQQASMQNESASATSAVQGKISEEIARCQRYPSQFVVMVLELQGLPDDLPGAAAVIMQVEHLIRANTRVVDLIAHEAHGRFLIMLPHTGREARVLGERACAKIAAREWQAGGLKLDARVGFAVYPHDGETMGTLYQCAERRLPATEAASATPPASASTLGGHMVAGRARHRLADLVTN